MARTRDARVYRRVLALLEASRGRSIVEIASSLLVSRRTVYHWLDRYSREHDPGALQDQSRPGRPPAWSNDLVVLFEKLLGQSPDQLGYYAVNWTVPLLQEHLEHCTGRHLSDDTVRRQLQRMGYVWKRSRYVLTPDPDKEKKTPYPCSDQEVATWQCAARSR